MYKKIETIEKNLQLALITDLAARPASAACASERRKNGCYRGPAAGTCKTSRGRPRRLRAAGRSTAPGTSGSWRSKHTGPVNVVYAGQSARRHEFRRHGASPATVQLPAATTSSCPPTGCNAGHLHVAGLHGRHPLRCTLRDPYRGNSRRRSAQHTARCGSFLHYLARRPETDGQRHAPPSVSRVDVLFIRAENGCRNGRPIPEKRAATFSAPRNWPGETGLYRRQQPSGAFG